ncbi:hypothetical protein BDV95DRAFT_610203 [Massariosphaeria phaeospora]|uniref:Zn(2)-C6 fungal-type domain-containing protein n=1 Tax=Massariosphaeria phaeospora TaxID=100035 RepID=A0A7C8M457_9PLEO|nr:hypothetical protein BDV95DRAFT_610203 [Massariosphaeria phaeospora]
MQPSQGLKIAIPRMDPPRRPDNSPSRQKEKRIGNACTECRKRKIRCGGELPTCKACDANNRPCSYGLSRRDRGREVVERNESLVSLLKDLSLRADNADKQLINDALQANEDEEPPSFAPTPADKTHGKRRREDPVTSATLEEGAEYEEHGEYLVTGSVGSNEEIHSVDEDLLRNKQSMETGFVGKNSEVQWLRTLQSLPEDAPFEEPHGPPGNSTEAVGQRADALHQRRSRPGTERRGHVTDFTFYLDSDDIAFDIIENPHEFPVPETAERLIETYFTTLHRSFPILPASSHAQFLRFFSARKEGAQFPVPDKWRALLNLVLAIGARYSHLIDAEWQGNHGDDTRYMIRAVRLLQGKQGAMVLATPDSMLIQATGLLSLYYLIIGHVGRGWIMIGISLRFSLAVGLHLRNETPPTLAGEEPGHESMVWTWWGLHSLERLLCAMTGRPFIITVADCTAQLPPILPEELFVADTGSRLSADGRMGSLSYLIMSSPTSPKRVAMTPSETSYFDASVKLNLITQKILYELYSPQIASQNWAHIQKTIRSLASELEEWAQMVIPAGCGTNLGHMAESRQRDQIRLSFHYCSSKLLLTRPCLCRVERRIKNQSTSSVNFDQRAAETCVEAARDMTALLPEVPNPRHIYERGPWWAIVHYIMQALAVFLLEIHFRKEHTMIHKDDISVCARKLLHWLRVLRKTDSLANRAYNVVCRNILDNKVAEIRDLLNYATSSTTEPLHNTRSSTGAPPPSQSAWLAPDLPNPDDYYPAASSEFTAAFQDPSESVDAQHYAHTQFPSGDMGTGSGFMASAGVNPDDSLGLDHDFGMDLSFLPGQMQTPPQMWASPFYHALDNQEFPMLDPLAFQGGGGEAAQGEVEEQEGAAEGETEQQ